MQINSTRAIFLFSMNIYVSVLFRGYNHSVIYLRTPWRSISCFSHLLGLCYWAWSELKLSALTVSPFLSHYLSIQYQIHVWKNKRWSSAESGRSLPVSFEQVSDRPRLWGGCSRTPCTACISRIDTQERSLSSRQGHMWPVGMNVWIYVTQSSLHRWVPGGWRGSSH